MKIGLSLLASDPPDQQQHDNDSHNQAETIAGEVTPVGAMPRLWRVLVGAVSNSVTSGRDVLAGAGGGVAGAQQGCCTDQDE